MRKPNDTETALPDDDMPDSTDEEMTVPAETSDDAETQPPEDPDDPLADPQVKAGFETLKELVVDEGDVEFEMGRVLNRMDEALRNNKARHGRWGKILKDDLGLGYKKASRARAHANFHAWAERTGNLDHLSKIPRSARYLLGAPKTEDEQREDAIRCTKEDGRIDIETVERIVGGAKEGGEDESPEDRDFRRLAQGFDRWLKKFNEADAIRDRVIADVRTRHEDFVASICPPSDQTE